jgi:hypothetical protein
MVSNENNRMRTLAPFRTAVALVAHGKRTSKSAAFFCFAVMLSPLVALAQSTATDGAVTIVLPPKVVAGHPATLAALGADGRLAPNVAVELRPGVRVTTDRTGRALFVVPASDAVLLAKASGASAVALVDPAQFALGPPATTTVTPVVALHDPFAICAAGLSGGADANLVKINGEFALVLAASPECLVVLPPPTAKPGPAKVWVAAPPTQAQVTQLPAALPPMIVTPGPLTLVSLDFARPSPPLQPGEKSLLTVHVRGSDQPLRIVVENESPGVLAFRNGDSQELRTSGGPQNVAEVEVQAIRSGDFSFHARVLPAPDAAMALRYLQAAAAIAPANLQGALKSLADRLAHHPNDAEKIRLKLEQILAAAAPGDFPTLLDAARSAL